MIRNKRKRVKHSLSIHYHRETQLTKDESLTLQREDMDIEVPTEVSKDTTTDLKAPMVFLTLLNARVRV